MAAKKTAKTTAEGEHTVDPAVLIPVAKMTQPLKNKMAQQAANKAAN